MNLSPPFDDWNRRMDHYDRRIDVLARRVPVPGRESSPLYTQQLATLRDRHAEILDLIQRSQTSPDHMRADQARVIQRLAGLERDIEDLERSER